MKIILGLGNPGSEYAGTRHNVGFMLVDKLKEKWTFPDFELNKKFQAEISKGKIGTEEIILVKPQTFMNLSGEAAQSILSFYKLTPNDLIAIHDDLDIALGRYKLASDSSSAGHNGVAHIIDKIGTQKFCRVRVGIGPERGPQEDGQPQCRLGAHDFVLGKLTPEEIKSLEKISRDVLSEIEKNINLKKCAS